MKGDKFNIIYLALFIAIVVIRKYFERKYGEDKYKAGKGSSVETLMLSGIALGMIAPLFFILTPWLDFAGYRLPEMIRWTGMVLFIAACAILWKSHADLKNNFTPVVEIKENHNLVTDGIFRYIRHPIYAAHLLWALAQLFIIPDWIAGPVFLVFLIPFYLYRMPKEENMMIKEFGEKYKTYMKNTGAILPKL